MVLGLTWVVPLMVEIEKWPFRRWLIYQASCRTAVDGFER